jgi:hypothetical protein
MRHIALAFVFLISVGSSAMATVADHSATVFPPAECSSTYQRIVTWMTGSTTTYCKSLDKLLRETFSHCANGQALVKEDGRFVCKSLGAADLGRAYYGAFCADSNHCYAFCPRGKVVMSGGCFSNRAYSLQGSKAVVYDRLVVGNGGHNPNNPDGAVSVSPGRDAYEGWQCIYPTASEPRTDIEAHVLCINSGLTPGIPSDDDEDPGREPVDQ